MKNHDGELDGEHHGEHDGLLEGEYDRDDLTVKLSAIHVCSNLL